VGWIAALSALVLLVTSLGNTHANSQPGHDGTTKPASIDFEAVLHKVEWATLLFFAGLFVFMRSIEELGLLTFLANHISDLIKSVEDKSDRLVFALLMLILLSALISSLIDNIPFTTAMIPIIIQLSEQADVYIFFSNLIISKANKYIKKSLFQTI
jgi:Na+/H+ antiporter NhaD/arsenite permease-like protein